METTHGRDDVKRTGARMWAAAVASATKRRGGGAPGSEGPEGGGRAGARDEEKMASRDRVAQAKSRAERSRPPTVPVPQVEIVPGRLFEGDWLSFLSCEEAEDSVGDILAGMLEQVMEECYKVYLARQCVPYVINQAREAMFQIIEWRFLVRDEGETDVPADPAWQEDEEPVPCITDSWAEGSVPVMQATSGPQESEVPLASLQEEAPPAEKGVHARDTVRLGLGPLRSLLKEEEEEEEEEQQPQPSLPDIPPAGSRSSRVPLRSQEELPPVKAAPTLLPLPSSSATAYTGPPRASRFSCPLTSPESSEKERLLQKPSRVPLEEEVGGEEGDVGRPLLLPPSCSNLLRIQLGRPPNTKDVFYDERGRITLVPRLDPARLPKRWIRPAAEVVDPDAESRRQEALKTVSGRCARRRHPRRGGPKHPRGATRRDTAAGPGGVQPPGAPPVLLPFEGLARAVRGRLSEPAVRRLPPPGQVLEPTALIFVEPTLLVETVELAPGVTLHRGGSADRRLPPVAPQGEEEAGTACRRELRPLRPEVPFPAAATEQQATASQPLPRLHPGAAARSGCPC